MRYLLAGGLGLFAVAAVDTASAADLSLKAPAAIPAAPAYDWTGFYVGGNAGYGVSRDPSSETLTFPNGTQFSDETFTLGPAGALGGGQVGGNLQTGNWVLGLEGDWQWTGQKDSVCIQTCSVGTGALNDALTVGQKIAWLATLRGRIGYADGAFLWYATGGSAFGRVTFNDVSAVPTVGANFDHTLGGWTLGAGIEAALVGNWTAKLEYLYVDLGGSNDAFVTGFGNTQAIHSSVHDSIMRLGLNYRFGNATAPAVPFSSAATPIFNWTGFYVGGNAGYGGGHNKGNEILPIPPVFPADTAQSFTHAPSGWPIGGQAGYNWQSGRWVAGLESDWQWTHQQDSISITMGTPPSNLNNLGLTIDETLRWLATFRGRVGFDHDDWLWFVTGGGAVGSIAEHDMLTVIPPTVATNFSHTLAGWTVGAGVEKAIASHWTAKLEYLYVDLGSMTDTIIDGPGVFETIHQNVTDQIVRFGLNYRF